MTPIRNDELRRILGACEPDGDPAEALVLADTFLERGLLRLAASALDRAYGLAPGDPTVARQRSELLDQLSLSEHGLRFRYVPAGAFLMGSDSGDCDERPVHRVLVSDYWLTDVPITWAAFCDLMGWSPPPESRPGGEARDEVTAGIYLQNPIRLQYCETDTRQASDWHAHAPDDTWQSGGKTVTSSELFGEVDRQGSKRPWAYDRKPMVAVSVDQAEELGRRLSTERVTIGLPTEVQWERAARGGLIGARYSWGDAPPDPGRCDCDHFGDFVIRDPTDYPPNGYGLHGMCGTVWEYTATSYDALAYSGAPDADNPTPQRVLRGGSWADGPDAVTVSFRMSVEIDREHPLNNPNTGFRLCRREPKAEIETIETE